MNIYLYFFIFLIGLALGSFFNVIILRFGSKRGVIGGRSKCLSCGTTIKWFDLIPIFSYFMLKKRCRNCKKTISHLYPIVEGVSALIFLLFFIYNPTISFLSVLKIFIIMILVLIMFFDIRYFIIPDKMLILITGATIISKLIAKNTDFYQLLISGVVLTSFFAILYIASGGKWIGLGDIKLIFLIGFLLGYPAGYLSIIIAVWSATIFSITLIIAKRANIKTKIPMGSFLSAAVIIFIIFNNELQEIYKYFI